MVSAGELMNKDFLKVEKTDTIANVIGKLIQKDVRTAVVFWNKEYFGIIDRDLLVQSKITKAQEVGDFVMSPPVVRESEDMLKCAELMYGSYPCVLIVKRGNEVIGIVSAKDIIKLITNIPELRKMRADDVMTSNLIVLAYNARLGDAINIMHEKKFERVPIVDKNGHLEGIFTLTDAIYKNLTNPLEKEKGSSKSGRNSVFTRSYNPKRMFVLDAPIGDAASPIMVTANSYDKLGKIVEDMFNFKISDVVIAKDNKPIGIITTRDLLRAFAFLKEPEFWKLHFLGLNRLKPMQAQFVREAVAEHYEKIKRAYFKEMPRYFLTEIKLHDEPDKPNKRIKYSVHIRLAMPSEVFSTENANFDLGTAVSWALKDMERMLGRFKEKRRDRWTTDRGGRRAVFGQFEADAEKADKRGVRAKPQLIKR
jgi:CBS domain-containing protein/ribosome-associated translation inhibitor RaiA